MLIRSRAMSLLVMMLLLLAAGGCIFSPDDDGDDNPPPPTPTLPWPDTPDKLMTNFETVYSGMDIVGYRDEVLSPDYIFVLQNETVEEFQLPDNIYEFSEDVAIQDKMFSGQPNSLGKILTDIEIQVLQPDGTWNPVPASDPYFGGFPGAKFRNYTLLFYFNVQGDFRYEVAGNSLFYVTADTLMHNGVMTPRYRLLGQLDRTSATQ